MGCLQSKSKAEGGAESTSGLPPLPGADGSPESAVSETGTIAERAESLAKRWCACEAMMLQPSMEPERGEMEPELGVGAGDKLESHAGMLSMPRGKHGKAKVIGVNNQPPTKEALDRLEDRIFDREAQRLRRLRSFRATLNALQVDPTARTSKTAAGIEALGDAIGKLDAAIESAEPVVARRDALRAAATTLADVPGVAAAIQAELRLDPIVHARRVAQEIKRARATRDAYDAAVAAASTTRTFLLATVAAAVRGIREVQHELAVQRDGAHDTLRRGGGACNAANFGGRTERHLAALNAERDRLETVAGVARAVSARATREAEMNVMREYEPELRTLRAQRDDAFMRGARSVAFDDENWRAVPFARALMARFRETLAVRNAWEGMIDELAAEVVEEAIPAAQREARNEIKEVMNAVFGWSSSSDESSSDGDDDEVIPGSFKALTPKTAKSRWRSMTWRKPANSPRLTSLASRAFARNPTTSSMPEAAPALPPEPTKSDDADAMESDETDEFQSAASSTDDDVSDVSSVATEDLPVTDDEGDEAGGDGSLPPMPAEPVTISGLPPLRVE